MSEKLEKLTALVQEKSHSNGQPNAETNHDTSPNTEDRFRTPSPLSHNNHHSSASTPCPRIIKVGAHVVLKSFGNFDEIVAFGFVTKLNGVKANGMDLGGEFCEVFIQQVIREDVRLFFAPSYMETMRHALTTPIPWPLSLVSWNDDRN